MNKIFKLFGIIVFAAVIGFVLIACEEDDPQSPQKTQAEKDADAFRDTHKGILGKDINSVTINDLDDILAALDAYQVFADAQRDAVLKLLSKDKEKLDAMLAVLMVLLTDEEKFKITHRAILEKDFDDISSADKTAVDAALATYNSLSQAAKDELIEEIAQLGAFKFKIDHPVITRTDKTIAIADKSAVEAAGAAFDGLEDSIAGYLYYADITFSIFDNLLAAIEDMEFAFANADYILDVIGEVTALRKKGESVPKKPGWTRYEAENAVKVNGENESQLFYSEGKGVNGIQNPDKMNEMPNDWSTIINLDKKLAYIKFTVNAASEDDYIIDLIYNGNDNKTILVKFWGMAVPLSLPEVTGQSWDTMFTHRFILKGLSEGENEIWISNVFGDDTAWMNIDCIDVIKAGDMDPIDAAAYMSAHGAILDKPVNNLVIGDAPAVAAARNAYNALRSSVKALLDKEQNADNKLKALEAKIFELEEGASPEELAANYLAQFTVILSKEAVEITNRSFEAAINEALDAWEALKPQVKAVQSIINAKIKLDALKAKVDSEIFYDEYWGYIDSVPTILDEAGVLAALNFYNNMSAEAQAYAEWGKEELDKKKQAIDEMWTSPLLIRIGAESQWDYFIPRKDGWTRYEAEDAVIVSDRPKSSAANFFSGTGAQEAENASGVTVNSINASGWSGVEYIDFTVNAVSAGDYLFYLQYVGDNPKNVAVALNDGTVYELFLGGVRGNDNEGQWGLSIAYQFLLKGLTAGNNKVRISGRLDGWNWLHIDCLDVRNAPFVRPAQ